MCCCVEIAVVFIQSLLFLSWSDKYLQGMRDQSSWSSSYLPLHVVSNWQGFTLSLLEFDLPRCKFICIRLLVFIKLEMPLPCGYSEFIITFIFLLLVCHVIPPALIYQKTNCGIKWIFMQVLNCHCLCD